MFKHFALLLSIVTCPAWLLANESTQLVSQDCQILSGRTVGFTANDVVELAAANSSTANLLTSERASLSASVDRDDRQQCAQLALLQKVIDDLACYERARSAAQALTIYHQLVGLERQKLLLDDAYVAADQLLRFANKADELDIKDGNRFELDKQRLQIADQKLESIGTNAKLRIALGELVGKPYAEVESVHLSSRPQQSVTQTVDASIMDGLARRCDIQAIEQLCRSLSADSLPAMRQLLGSLQPGLGLAIALTARRPLLNLLDHDDDPTAELCRRRQQCARLLIERRGQAEAQIRAAYVERQTAMARLEIAKQHLQIDEQLVRRSLQAVELEKVLPGAELIAELARLKSQGRVVELETGIAVADVKLAEATGTILQSTRLP